MMHHNDDVVLNEVDSALPPSQCTQHREISLGSFCFHDQKDKNYDSFSYRCAYEQKSTFTLRRIFS